jgi:site-specific DNA-methyltransferase (adenine-specific)
VREEIIGDARLILGDCRDILPTLGKVDAVVTDPPYGIGFSKGESGKRVTGSRLTASRWTDPIVGDDEPFDPALLLSFPEVIAWGADHYRTRLPESGRFLAWDKKAGWEFEDTFSDVEFAWHSEGGASKIIDYLWKGVRQDGEKGLPKYHIMQKPIAVMLWCIRQLRGDARTILDPFMGSGTTGVACAKLGRRFIGVEIEEAYFNIACRRIEEAYKQADLFIAPPSKSEQLSMEAL